MKLRGRRVLIAGVGGLGTVSAELLASIGIGYLKLVDYDVVELSNLPRQKLYSTDDIGKAKVEVAKQQLTKRNPDIDIEIEATRIDPLSAPQLLEGIDLVIDGLDLFSTRKSLFRVARRMKIPYIFAGSIAEQANLMVFTHEQDKPCLECVVGNIGDNPEQSCEIQGVHPSILSIAGSIQVAEAIKLLLNQESELNGKMLYIDLITLDFDKITFKKKDSCRLCGKSQETDELDEGKPGEITKGIRKIGDHGKALVTSLCGRDTKIIDPEWEINWEFNDVKSKLEASFHLAVSGEKYATFNVENIGVSLLNSGVATIRGSKTTRKAIEIYDKVYSLIAK